jgi:hypothetical protein
VASLRDRFAINNRDTAYRRRPALCSTVGTRSKFGGAEHRHRDRPRSEGVVIPIRKYVSDATFGPETIKDMTTAFERIRTILKLEDPDDPLVDTKRP